jgi:hypothetical protein
MTKHTIGAVVIVLVRFSPHCVQRYQNEGVEEDGFASTVPAKTGGVPLSGDLPCHRLSAFERLVQNLANPNYWQITLPKQTPITTHYYLFAQLTDEFSEPATEGARLE